MLVHYGHLWGKKLKNKYGVERLTTRRLHGGLWGGVGAPPPGHAGMHQEGALGWGEPQDWRGPPFLCATSTVLAFALL